MKKIGKFLQIPQADQALLIKSAFFLMAVRLGLWLLPAQTLRELLARKAQPTIEPRVPHEKSVLRVASSVRLMSHYVPAATCLTQALAAHALLCKLGQPSHLRIGVAKSKDGQLQAHAWVESQGKIVIGNQVDLSRFTMLRTIKEEIS